VTQHIVFLCINQYTKFEVLSFIAKFDESSFSGSRDIIGASKFKVDHVILTTPF